MGEIFRFRNLRFCIFPKDHGPPHVHVLGPGCEAKYRIDNYECFYARGFSAKALRSIRVNLIKRNDLLWEVWSENQK